MNFDEYPVTAIVPFHGYFFRINNQSEITGIKLRTYKIFL